MNIQRLFLFFLTLFSVSTVYSQTTFTSLTAETNSMGNRFEHILVKEHQYPNTVTCNIYDSVTDPFTAFGYQYVQDSVVKSRYVFLKGYLVFDFKVSTDSVFFCGTDSLNNAIIGFFDIQDLFFNNGTFFIQNTFQTYAQNETHKVERFTKLVTYRTPSNARHIVCIGYIDNTVSSLNSGCIVDLYYSENKTAEGRPVGLWAYASGELYKTQKNSLMDIDIIDNWIITAGFENTNYITLRTYKSDNIFSLTGPQNSYREFHIFQTSTTYPKKWNPDELHLATINNDTIATAASWISNGNSGGIPTKMTRRINIAQYRIIPTTGAITPTMLSLDELYFRDYPNEVKIQDFIANKPKRRLAMILEAENRNGDVHSLFFESNNKLQFRLCNKNTYFDWEDEYDMLLGGIDTYNNRKQYIMAGADERYKNYHIYRIETSEQSSLCQPSVNVQVNNVPVVSSEMIEYPFNVTYGIGNIIPVSRFIMYNWNTEISCIE